MKPQSAAVEVDSSGALRAFLHRFAGLYLLAYVLPCLAGFPGSSQVVDAAWELKRRLLGFLAEHFLRVGALSIQQAAGFDLAMIFTLALPAFLVALAWTSVVPALSSTELRWRRALELYLRVMLASSMLLYAFQKLFPLQFPAPTLADLAQPIGSFTPMRLFWSFMGSSREYQCFGGVAELVGAVLLFFRRTTTVGALVLVVVLANVVALDHAFQVSVLFEAAHLLTIALFLAAPDLPALGSALFGGFRLEGLDPRLSPFPSWPRAERVTLAALAGWVIASNAFAAWRWSRPRAPEPRAALAGVYEVEDFHSPAGALPDAEVWRDVAVDSDGKQVTLVMADGSSHVLTLETSDDRVALVAEDGLKQTFRLMRPDATHLSLDGPVGLRLLRLDAQHFERLRSR